MDREAVRCGRLIGTDRCGSLLQRGCLSCPKCEGTVDASVWEDVPSLRVCGAALGDGSRCDWQISFNCKFCPECGIKLGSGKSLFTGFGTIICRNVSLISRRSHTCKMI